MCDMSNFILSMTEMMQIKLFESKDAGHLKKYICDCVNTKSFDFNWENKSSRLCWQSEQKRPLHLKNLIAKRRIYDENSTNKIFMLNRMKYMHDFLQAKAIKLL